MKVNEEKVGEKCSSLHVKIMKLILEEEEWTSKTVLLGMIVEMYLNRRISKETFLRSASKTWDLVAECFQAGE